MSEKGIPTTHQIIHQAQTRPQIASCSENPPQAPTPRQLPLSPTHAGNATEIQPQIRAMTQSSMLPQPKSPDGRLRGDPTPQITPASLRKDPHARAHISAYARLDFDTNTFYVQTLQVVLGRKATHEHMASSHHSVDVHLSLKKAILRRHAKIFYNFGTQRFEISVLGRNGAFVDDSFIEKGITVPLVDNTKIQIGDIPFTFVLPSIDPTETDPDAALPTKFFNPSDALNLRNMGSASPKEDRRNSRADIVRRLSLARRKSLASSSNDEINALLKELETFGEIDESPKDDLAAAEPIDISKLDQEIASLAPLIDAHETDKPAAKPDLPSRPLSGPVAGPRMGKPATIQPPANRLYGRAGPIGQVPANFTYASPPYAFNGYSVPPRPPVPKLEVEVATITRVAIQKAIPPYRAITVDVDFFEHPPICVFKSFGGASDEPKVPLRRKDAALKKPARAQNARDVPDHYKTKPHVLVSGMISSVIRGLDPLRPGYTSGEILDAIKTAFPYYKYCPDGWQFAVTQQLKYNKIFRVVRQHKLESERLWATDAGFIEEREKTRRKQQETAMAKAKEAALRASEYLRTSMAPYTAGRPFSAIDSPYQARYTPQTAVERPKPVDVDSRPNAQYPVDSKPHFLPKSASESAASSPTPDLAKPGTIKDQLAANRAKVQGAPPAEVKKAASPVPAMTVDTKKSLTYLQKELFTLYKARNLTYNTTVTTEIITKALATTIAQVNIIGAKAGCGENALSFLVEKAPLQVSKILDLALTKSIKEKQGIVSAQGSRPQTPQPEAPKKMPPVLRPPSAALSSPSADALGAAELHAGPVSPAPRGAAALSKPGFTSGLSRPSFAGVSKPLGYSKAGALTKPPQFLSNKLRGEKRAAEEELEPRVVKSTKS